MKDKCISIYQLARNSTELTRECAAEMLHVSVRSLADYELGNTVPPDDVVCRMIDIYKCNWLGYEHLKNTEVGKRFLPNLDYTDLARSVLKFQKEVKDLDTVHTDMVDIACDGIVDKHEESKWHHVTKEIKEMAGAALAIIFANN